MTISDDSATSPLDAMERLPAANRRSIVLVLAVQALNAFNDNFVKMLLVSLGLTVARGTRLGDDLLSYLVIVFSVAFVLFAPIAGWLSDRFSKQRVIAWMQAVQLVCLAAIAAAIQLRDPLWSMRLGLLTFFLLAIQATIFSPAKLGIMKEIAGARRLGQLNGLLQMTMLVCTLGGIWAGGKVYESTLAAMKDPWLAALWPIAGVGALGGLQLLASFFVQGTPDHREVAFRPQVAWEHFGHLKLLFAHRQVRLAGIGITFFWFIANAVGIIVKQIATDMGRGPAEVSNLAASLGVGVMIGSLIAGAVCKRRIELGLIPLAGCGMVVGSIASGLVPLTPALMYGCLCFIGVAGGCYMVPLYAYVQDRAVPDQRSRILSSINLMDCLATIIVSGLVLALAKYGLTGQQQMIFFGGVAVIASIYTTKLLPHDLVRFVLAALIRAVYKVRGVHVARVPRTGGVLLLPNHVSYADALVISVACERPVRFVMWDTLYKLWWLNGFLRFFGTVPISSTRAKDAVRTVAEALKAGECVCLFPEGQLTRVGMMNEIRKGFELMVRQSGVPVVPVYQDGLWGSVFSYEGKGAFKKLPKKLRYPVSIWFGEPIPAEHAKTEVVREALLALSSEAMADRSPQAKIAEMNQMRIDAITPHDPSGRYVDAATGAIIAVQVPDPVMPEPERNMQLGTREGTLGRLLPGLAARQFNGALVISGLAPTSTEVVTLPGAHLDDMGFIVKAKSE